MTFPNIFTPETTATIENRLSKLDTATKPQWGKMNAGQMLAHLNVMYEMVYDNIHPKPNAFMRFIISAMAKKQVVGPKPYPKNGQTAPQFLIKGDRDFDKEKSRLITYMQKGVEEGEDVFDGRTSNSFGKLSKDEWNTMFYKHIDHHFMQFGV